jgi:hypothetical protein
MKTRTPVEMMAANTIVKCYAGSHAYGTNIATSDVDFRGIFVADPIYIRTPFYTTREVEDKSEEDTKFYELNQFMKLAVDCNPNVIEIIWTDMEHVVLDSPAYQLLRKHASQLLSSKIAFTTTGYAMSQLARIKGHNKWINNPMPEVRPTQQEFFSLVTNFTPDKILSINDLPKFKAVNEITDWCLAPMGGGGDGTVLYGVYDMPGARMFDKEGVIVTADTLDKSEHTPLYIVKFNRPEYTTAVDKWKHYWDWKKNRNVKRSALEEQFGYDTKHAMHLVRLLHMGKEALSEGIIHVKRPDAKFLLSIRDGAWTYEQVLEYANQQDSDLKALAASTSLPKKPPVELAANLILTIQDMVWMNNKQS